MNGQDFKEKMKKAGFSQRSFAVACGITEQQISYICNDKADVQDYMITLLDLKTEIDSLRTLDLDCITDACNKYLYSVYPSDCLVKNDPLALWDDENQIKQAYDDIASDVMGDICQALVGFHDKEFEDVFHNYEDIRTAAQDEAYKMIEFVEKNNLYG
jgi:transcriptional regulator with XRE-family HTH domain